MMKLAFYKGEGKWEDKAIRIWTRSKYSHVEIVIGGVGYSSSWRDGGVRAKDINFHSGNWDVFNVAGNEDYALQYFRAREGMEYDMLGIALTQFIPLGIHSLKKYFCSELNAGMLGLGNPHRLSPQGLFERKI